MEMGFDHGDLRPTASSLRDSIRAPAPLDWAGIKARFAAAHALRRAVAQDASHCAGGSFTQDAAWLLAEAREASPAVNPNALANCKSLDGKGADIVGTPQTGDRG